MQLYAVHFDLTWIYLSVRKNLILVSNFILINYTNDKRILQKNKKTLNSLRLLILSLIAVNRLTFALNF